MSIDSLIAIPLEPNKIYSGDARVLLPRVRRNSVACSVWSPPYFVGKRYEVYLKSYEAWSDLIRETIGLHFPIIKPGGFVVINIADILCFPDPSMPRIPAENVSHRRSSVTRRDVQRAIKKHPNYNRYQLADLLGCSEQTVDRRLNGNNIRGGKYSAQTRVRLVAGQIEEWATAAGFYVYDRRVWVKDPCWQNSEWHTTSYRSVDEFEYLYFLWKPGTTTVDRSRLTAREWAEWGSRGAWQIPSVRSNDDHEAKFPIELPRRVIRLLTAPDDLVLDCFVGSGTTAVAAINEGRRYIGMELDAEYASLARSACSSTTRPKQTVLLDRSEYPEPAMLPFAAAAQS
jgi:site-specific DNA-methyltransferase (adenine-specific)